jgi:xylan 1,4-beta-xylosidase
MKRRAVIGILPIALLCIGCQTGLQEARIRENPMTYCNPVNISYRFMVRENPDSPSRREAADPSVVMYKGDYYLFASKSGGYWWSSDMSRWNFVAMDTLPSEDYAPTIAVMGDTMLFKASSWDSTAAMYLSTDPKSGKWRKIDSRFPNWDPNFFVDDDRRLYFYWGCSPNDPIRGVELDPKNNFRAVGKPADLFKSDTRSHGWENVGDDNQVLDGPRPPEVPGPWIEGPWMTKHDGSYYLQYAAPGTEYASYADGVVIGRRPLGPFRYAPYNPVCFKPKGFIQGAGHGCTFEDRYGNFWRAATNRISVKHVFERRLGIFPAGFDADGVMFTQTVFGDYPHVLPTGLRDEGDDAFAGWMLLSYQKDAEASSSIKGYEPEKAFDEDIRTYWAAESGGKDEWLRVDLGKETTVNAVQVNFAEHGTALFGRVPGRCHRYKLWVSKDGKAWGLLADRSKPHEDLTHEYFELEKPAAVRFIRLSNIGVPDGNLAVSGLRVFGNGGGEKPRAVDGFTVARDAGDPRHAVISWKSPTEADGVIVRFGIAPDKLYLHFQVQDSDTLHIRALNRGVAYFFRLDTFNENGWTEGAKVLRLP